MSDSLPNVTVIIPTRPDGGEPKAAVAARALDYPPDKLEIIVARGRQPSVQRNVALRAAKGELIYFLDDDSIAVPDNLRRTVGHFRDAKVQIVGGPNVCPDDAPGLEQVFALVLASWLAFGPSRARYTPVGKLRETGEKELILCNQLGRRAAILQHGGFNEALYPNEENALMDDIRKAGGKLLYDPELVVYRRPRRTLKSFAKMLLTYGRGRAEQFRVNPTRGSTLNFAPPLFLVYLLTLPVLWRVNVPPESNWFLQLYHVPLLLYLVALMLQTMALVPRGGIGRALGAMPLMMLSHVLYGAGFWQGLFTKLHRASAGGLTNVTLETISP